MKEEQQHLQAFIKAYYAGWTDDDLYDRFREIKVFGGNEIEKMMLTAESNRRVETNEKRSQLS